MRSTIERMVPLELLEREITDLACRIHAATCRWLTLVAEYDRREGWAQWGCKSCALDLASVRDRAGGGA